MILRNRNYKNNKLFDKTLPDGLLNGQGIGALKRYRYGLFSFSWCGCEIIACYNLLKMHGTPMPLSEICKEIYPYGQILLGFFGTNVYTLAHFFKKHAVPVETVYSKQQFLNRATNGKYGVVSFWTGGIMASSIHTVAYSAEKDGKIKVYNRYNNTDKVYEFDSVSEAFGKYHFIVANIL